MCFSDIGNMMTNEEIRKIAIDLIPKINSAVILDRATVSVGDWVPKENRCHDNVRTMCKLEPGCEQIYGWLYADLSEFGYVSFMFHSAIKRANGETYDITPTTAMLPYPFIESNLPESEYLKLMDIFKDTNKIDVSITNT